jgi:DNA-binding transcriptional LysR family regulator
MEPDRWLRMELRYLIALQAVAREGTFADAALSLGYTQSAVSQQIAALERVVGQRLIDRPGGRRRVSLTEAGEVLLHHADAIVARLHAAGADLAALAVGASGPLRIGTYQSVSARILPPLVRDFARAWPSVQLDVRESASDDELFGLLVGATIELAYSLLPPPEGPFDTTELVVDPYVLLVTSGSPLADGPGPPRLEEVGRLPLVGFRECRQEQWIEAHLRANGIEPQWVFRSDDNATIQAMVAAGVGAAIVPRLTIDAGDPRTVAIELDGVLPPRRLGLAWHRDRSRSAAAVAFTELACAAAAEV